MRYPGAIMSLMVLLSSCQTGPFFEKNRIIPGQEWEAAFRPAFPIDIDDTTASYDVFLNIRHTPYYRYSNLYLVLKEIQPDSIETLHPSFEVKMADQEGRWLGQSAGHLYQQTELWKENHRFSDTGRYTLEIDHQMEDPTLIGINDIGIKVIKK